MTHKISGLQSFATILRKAFAVLTVTALIGAPVTLKAQTGGQGAITGTVADSTGAAIADATVTATNTATNVSTTRTTTGAGAYTIAPLQVGVYSLQVTAKGFKTLRQDNLDVNALNALGFDPVLSLGEATETVVVTGAPPVLDTTNATVGLVMENSTYSALPLQMNNAQRDATAFASLAPGAQAGTRVPIVGGTGNFLGQLYLDGLPAQTINQQGDNRLVSQAVNLDAVDQFQVVTSTPPAEYSGAGALNFTMKSGGSKYHGQVSDFIRNTAFDAWSFTAKAATVKNLQGQTIPAPKPSEHQNELSITLGGHVPHTANKLFFFVAYDKFHSRRGGSPQTFTIATSLMQQGDFTELNGNAGTGFVGIAGDPSGGINPATNKPFNPAVIYDPTSNVCVGTTCTRTPFQGLKNGVPTNNVIPASYLSPVALKMQSFLPAPTFSNTITNNYLGSNPSGFDDNAEDWRVDFDLSAKQRISTVGAMGAVHYLNNYQAGGTGVNTFGFIPLPYVGGTIANIYPKVYQVEDTYTINDRLINQLKYGFTRFIQPQITATDGMTQYEPAALGITNTPAGQASTVFPGVSFGTTGAIATSITGWAGPANGGFVTQSVSPSTYALLDNLQWQKGKHAITGGFSFMWEQINTAAPKGFSGITQLPFNSNSTAQYASNSNALSSSSGNSYASFLLGAVAGTSLNLQPVSEVGGRYHVAAPFVQDNWKVTNKLTIDMGVRWDYFPPFHEVKDRWTFLNPNLTNAATGTPGMLQFAGNYGGTGVSCNCSTPVQPYWKNFGPRVGLAFALDEKTVFRGGIARVFSQAGGVGGRGGNAGGTGQLGFNVSATSTELTSGASAGPSFYLNNGTTFTSKGLANTDLFGKGYTYPGAPTPGVAAQLLNTGNYLDSNGKLVTAGSVTLADFYISGRAPEFTFFNAGIERSITKDMTIAVNYAGDQSHFLSTGANRRGFYANQLNPIYIAALGPLKDSTGTKPLLIAAATSANVAKAQAVMSGLNIPAFFQTAANANPTSSTLTVAQGLVAFPQYSGVSDLWGSNSSNLSYHSLQITLLQRRAHGLSFNVNYTYSKNIGDDGTFRSGFAIPAAAMSGGGQDWKQDRIDRSWTTISAPQVLHAFGVYELPFGKGHMGNDSMLMRTLVGGWQVAGIYTYGSGTPVAIISNHCTSTNFPLQGQCMPDVAIGAMNARIGGSYGSGPNGTVASNIGTVKYFDTTQFKTPTNVSTVPNLPIYLIGNAPRTQALNLRNPGNQNLDASLHRSFALPKDFGTFVFEVDCLNVWNKVQMSNPVSTVGASNFGTIGGIANSPRDFQFAGHLNF
jgi:Carboxypeptidase regulatory-like domain/TonB dependent receptor